MHQKVHAFESVDGGTLGWRVGLRGQEFGLYFSQDDLLVKWRIIGRENGKLRENYNVGFRGLGFRI